jgi:hypothetical protein
VCEKWCKPKECNYLYLNLFSKGTDGQNGWMCEWVGLIGRYLGSGAHPEIFFWGGGCDPDFIHNLLFILKVML